MKYVVYKRLNGDNVRWYAKPLTEERPGKYSYVFDGKKGKLMACQKAKELNDMEGWVALAA